MQHWYVYYKVTATEQAAVVERVRRMQGRIQQTIDVRMRLLERTGPAATFNVEKSDADTTTVMEVYEDIADPARFGAALDDALRFAELDTAHMATRRVERFEDA